MTADLTGILVSLGSFALVVLIVYFVTSYRYRERMEMLKMGLSPPPRVGSVLGTRSLWLGLVIGGIGSALLLHQFFGYDKERLLQGVVCLFIGAGMVVYYKMTAPQREQQRRLQEEHMETLARQIEATTNHAKTDEAIDTQ